MNKPKLTQLTLCLALLGGSYPAYAQLMFSQYVDGSKNRKGIELLNPDPQNINLADYEIRQYNNGKTTNYTTFKPNGELKSQARLLLGTKELKTAIGDRVQQVANLAFNGDDALILYYKGTPVDRFGRLGEQPRQGWGSAVSSIANSFQRINQTNTANSIDPTAPFDLEAQWLKWDNQNNFDRYLTQGQTPTDPSVPPNNQNVSCSSQHTPIANLYSAAQKKNYVVRGVITADYRYSNGFSGFYIQTPDSQAKPNVSNAIFVYIPTGSNVKGGKVGDEVVISGQLSTFENQLRIDQLTQDILSCNQNASAVQGLNLNLPFDSLTDAQGNVPQRYQGMKVKITQPLTISENYNYGRFGELALTVGRQYIPTNVYPAGSADAMALAKKNQLSKIILDDGYSNQNRTPWLPANFSAKNTLRSGTQLKNVEGILEYRFGGWRIQPIASQQAPEILANTNPRPTVQSKNAKNIRVAAFNVLNYDNGLAKGFPTERGADSKKEFDRQHQKIVSALKSIDADVYALMEIANNGYASNSAIAYLSKALGSQWKFVVPPKANKLGTDAIAVAIIYNSARVKPVNDAVIYDDGSERNRVTLAQSFQGLQGGKTFTVVPQHLKSKGSCPENANSPDADQKDGQGCWNATRLTASEKLMQWIATNPTKVSQPNFLILGDLNSYAKEEPILAYEKANYKVLLNDEKKGQGKDAYSYVFGVSSDANGFGGAGNLDHAIAQASLYPYVARTFAWHINADEPTALDYNEEFKTEQQKEAFYAADAYRSSDHDPVIVDLDFNANATAESTTVDEKKSGGGTTTVYSLFALLGLIFARKLWFRKEQ